MPPPRRGRKKKGAGYWRSWSPSWRARTGWPSSRRFCSRRWTRRIGRSSSWSGHSSFETPGSCFRSEADGAPRIQDPVQADVGVCLRRVGEERRRAQDTGGAGAQAGGRGPVGPHLGVSAHGAGREGSGVRAVGAGIPASRPRAHVSDLKQMERPGSKTLYKLMLGYASAASGKKEEGRRILEELEPKLAGADRLALISAFLLTALDAKDRAFEQLERAFQLRDPGLMF